VTFSKKPASFLEFIFFIASAQRACSKLPQTVAVDLQRKIATIDEAAYELLTDGRYEELLKRATAIEEEENQYTIAQSFAPDPDIDRVDTRGLIKATRQQIASRTLLLQDPQWRGHARVTDKWIEITEELVRALSRRLHILEQAFARVFPGERI
jgi:hypothetical protein